MRTTSANIELKYRDALTLYGESKLPIKDICEQTGVSFSAFSAYLSKYHRDKILKRHNLSHLSKVKLRGERGQTTAAHYKYKDAIAACDSQEYIEYNISQIARIFDVDCASLANQLRRHYSDIVPRRELARQRMGIAINLQYGVRKWTKQRYTLAVEMLQSSDMTIEEVALACDVSHTGLREHILAYYPQITKSRECKRQNAIGQKIVGSRKGNWTKHQPSQDTVEKYKQAIELYSTTSKHIEEIASLSGVSTAGLRYHLRAWHPELIVQRRGFSNDIDLAQTKRYQKSAAEKYAQTIERLHTSDLSMAKVAAEFGFNTEVFRMYLKEHYPNIVAERGRTKAYNGKMVSSRSAKKYAEAISLYQTTTAPLKTIAKKLGLTYSSLSGFIHRNYPEVIKIHNSLLISTTERL